jgi:hypothetical protein
MGEGTSPAAETALLSPVAQEAQPEGHRESATSGRVGIPSSAAATQILETTPVSSKSEDQDQADTKEAEKAAAQTLLQCHDALKAVAFVSYWSPDHVGWNSHTRNSEEITMIPPIPSHLTLPEPGGNSFLLLDPKTSSSGHV